MITVLLKCRLGNILFQYAVGRHLAIKHNTDLHLSLSSYRIQDARRVAEQIRSFRIPATLHMDLLARLGRCVGDRFRPSDKRLYCEKHGGFDPDVLAVPDGTRLSGYFHSEKYFKDIAQTIRDELRLKISCFDCDKDNYQDRIANSNSVAIHIRRGDYLGTKLLNVCNMNYYSKAIAYAQSRLRDPRFFVFSDDIEWCRKNISIAECSFVDTTPSRHKPIVDFELMRLCKHNINANSSYSWWAAWLNENPGKTVIVPNRWVNEESINALAMRDMVPEDWIRIDF